MPKVKDLIFKYDNKLKDGVDIEKEKSKKKFKEILEKFKSGNINTPTNINYEKPAIIHDEKFNNKLNFWKEKEKEVQEIQENPEEEHLEKVVKKKKKKDKKDKVKTEEVKEIIEPVKIEQKKEDLKKEKKSKKVKKEKALKNKDSEEDLEDEFEKMLKDLQIYIKDI